MKLPLCPYSLLVSAAVVCFMSCNSGPSIHSQETEFPIPEVVDFNYHVKPILSDKCFACHGPDEEKVEGGLRLDVEERALARLESGDYAIVPGKRSKSQLVHRITSMDPELQMPPPESNLFLSEQEKAVLMRWIEQGAEYKKHWSFIPPQLPPLPEVSDKGWARNPIDQFVQAGLEKEGLRPTEEADKTTLIRRLSFDLTGLPPTLEEIDRFLSDDSEDAYEQVVDRLLASEHFGERIAMDWLDVARYADSHGFHADGYRMMWPWRDWVIQAFNKNLPYDEFIVWQLAGDLIPDATLEQRLATGFNRNHPINGESGIVPEEYRLENVFDRNQTTAKAFLGLTLECARCHDHKYDPISQKDYYQLAAFFNNVDELGMMSVDGNAAPTMSLPSQQVRNQLHFLQQEIASLQQQRQQYEEVAKSHLDIEKIAVDSQFLQKGLVGHFPLDQFNEKQVTLSTHDPEQKASLHGEVEVVPGFDGKAARFDGEHGYGLLEWMGYYERYESFSMGAWVYPESHNDYRVILGNAGHKNGHWRGYEFLLDSLNRVKLRLTHQPPDHRLQVTTQSSIPWEEWSHVFFTYDGSSEASGIHLYINGKLASSTIQYDRLDKSIKTIDAWQKQKPVSLRFGRSYRFSLELGVFEGAIDEIRLYNRRLTELEVGAMVGNRFWEHKQDKGWDPQERSQLVDYFLWNQDTEYQEILAKLDTLNKRIHFLLDTVPEIMVMKEMPVPRPTYVLNRGMYDSPTEEVFPTTPYHILPSAASVLPNRLGLAQWLVHPQNPLTTRVLVNRYWHLIFGRGLVHTLDDFGNQGALPTHPELLDWLALEFIRSGWDLKALLRLMVTSATYRQSSVANAPLLELDPNNEWLARGPSYRLPAEMIRDNALIASGVWIDKIGGPSVKTVQPEGIWSRTHFSKLLSTYTPDQGEDLYRRGMYTFIRRTAPPPTMTLLGTPDRSQCVVQRQTTSTPLQALLLLNDPQMLEAARGIAQRVLKEAGPTLKDRLNHAFRLLTSRTLTQEELETMRELYEEEWEKYQENKLAVNQLLGVGSHPIDPSLDPTEIAALTVVSNIMMNYRESYTKR